MDQPKKLFICDNVDCRARGSLELADEIQASLDEDPDGCRHRAGGVHLLRWLRHRA